MIIIILAVIFIFIGTGSSIHAEGNETAGIQTIGSDHGAYTEPDVLLLSRQLLIPAGIIIALLLFAHLLTVRSEKKLKALQRELKSSKELFMTAANSADLVIWEYDPKSHEIVMSFDSDFTKYVCKERGFPQILERGPEIQASIIDEQDRPVLLEMYRKLDEGAEQASCEYGFPWSGLHCYRRVMAQTVHDEKSGRRKIVCISEDITAERRMQALYEKELQYLHQSNDATLTSKGHHDLTDGKVLEYTLLNDINTIIPKNITYDEMLQGSLSIMDREEDRKACRELLDRNALIQKCHDGERHFTFRFRRSKQGMAPGWAEIQCNTFPAPSTGHIECFIYTYDMTEQELKKQIISKLVDFGYENIGFIYPDTFAATAYLLNEPGAGQQRIGIMNYDEMLRYVLSKSSISEPQQKLFDAICIETVTKRLASATTYLYPFSLKSRDQKDERKQFAFSWLDEKHDTIFFCMSDITAQYEFAQMQIRELSAAKLAADQANEAKSAFLSTMSHDLRTPLNGILGFTDIALRENDPARKQEYLEKIRLSGDLLLSLVNDTLDLSRIESGKMTLEPEKIDSRDFARSVLAAVVPTAKQKNIRLLAEPDHFPGGTIYADRLKLQKIVLNLLSNAVKYTPEGGTIRFSIEAVDSASDHMTRRIVVADNGIGISRDFLENLYEPFAQEHRPETANIQGTGLGLSIVKKIVDLMGGKIEVTSEINKGTTFVVELPLQCSVSSTKQQEVIRDMTAELRGKHILLVEDNAINMEIAELLLKEKGIIVTTAEDGRKGVEKFLHSAEGFFDAILMDIRMPVMDGYEAVKIIRTSGRRDADKIAIIAMTAEAFEEDIVRARRSGMNDYLVKPIDSEKLIVALSSAINKETGKAL